MRTFILAILSLCILSVSADDLDVRRLVANGNPSVIHNGVEYKTKKAKEISYLVTDGTGQEIIMEVESPELKTLKVTKIKSAKGRLNIPDSVEIGNETYAVLNLDTKLQANTDEVRFPNTLRKIRTSRYEYNYLIATPFPTNLEDIGKSTFIKNMAPAIYNINSAQSSKNISIGTRFRTILDCSDLKYISNSGKLVDFDAFLSKHVRDNNWEEESLKYFIQKFNSKADGQLICGDMNEKENPNYKYYMIIKPILIDSSGRIWANIYISPISNINEPQFVMAFTAAGDNDDAIALRDPLKEAGEKIAKLILKSM